MQDGLLSSKISYNRRIKNLHICLVVMEKSVQPWALQGLEVLMLLVLLSPCCMAKFRLNYKLWLQP